MHLRIKTPDGTEFRHAFQIDDLDFLQLLYERLKPFGGTSTMQEIGNMVEIPASEAAP